MHKIMMRVGPKIPRGNLYFLMFKGGKVLPESTTHKSLIAENDEEAIREARLHLPPRSLQISLIHSLNGRRVQ